MPSKCVSVNTPSSQTFRLVSISDVTVFLVIFSVLCYLFNLFEWEHESSCVQRTYKMNISSSGLMKESGTNWKQVCVGLSHQTCWVDMSVFSVCPEQVNNIRLLCVYSKYFCPESVGKCQRLKDGM
jgi:hypothetical protein